MTATADFYDRAMTAPDAPSMLPLKESPWRPLYQEASRWIPSGHDVVDLGCGTGRFLAEVRLDGRHQGGCYGVDFSEAALAEARSYLGRQVKLACRDLREWEPDPDRAGHTTYVCLEVLEHLDDDCGLIRRVPPGHQFVFSVPNYESEAHQRWFRDAGDVWAAYQHLLAFRRWSLVTLDDRKAIHAVDAVRRADAW